MASKISMFQDKVYDDMDDISKLVEPIECEVNVVLSHIPDEVEVTPQRLQDLYNSQWGASLSTSGLVDSLLKELDIKTTVNMYSHAGFFFKFEVRSLDNEELTEVEDIRVNFETGVMSHRIFLIKHTIGYDDQTLENMAKSNLTRAIRSHLTSSRDVNKSRLNELAELFGAKDVKSSRAYREKVHKFCKHIDSLVDNKKLDIRDLSLCEKFSKWITLYVKDGNLAALNNITRIKIMMHENRPIYSIQEREVV